MKHSESLGKMYQALFLMIACSISLFAPEIAMAAGTNIGLGGLESNAKGQGQGFAGIMKIIAWVAGFGFVVASLFMANAASKPGAQVTWKQVAIAFLIGSALLSVMTVATLGGETALGSKSTSGQSIQNLGL